MFSYIHEFLNLPTTSSDPVLQLILSYGEFLSDIWSMTFAQVGLASPA